MAKVDAGKPLDWIAARPSLDWAAALLLVGGHCWLVFGLAHGDVLLWAGMDRRVMVYGAAAGVAALATGFGAVALGQYKGASGTQMLLVKRQHGETMRAGLRSTLTAPLLVAATCIVAMALDTTNGDHGGVRFVFEGAFFLGVARGARLTYLFGALLDVADVDESRPAKTPRGQVSFVPDRETA